MACIWVDENRRIIEADLLWDTLAGSNRAPHLKSDYIRGQSILKFIKGDPAKMYIDAILIRVNVSGKPYILNYRCDSGSYAQLMKMMVSKERKDRFCIEHDIVWRKTIRPQIQFTEDSLAEEQRCAICGKVQFKGEWYDALTNRRIFGTLTELKTRTVVCHSCQDSHPELILDDDNNVNHYSY